MELGSKWACSIIFRNAALVLICAIALIGCRKHTSSVTPPDSQPTSKIANKELTVEQATSLATKLATDEYRKKEFKSPDGKVILKDNWSPKWGVSEKEGNRWHFRSKPAPVGFEAEVYFDLDGGNPSVKVAYAWI